jgi:RHS repeat-associated protein
MLNSNLNIPVAYTSFNPFNKSRLVAQIVDGLGKSVNYEFDLFTNNIAFYFNGSIANHPNYTYVPNGYGLKNIGYQDGIGGSNQIGFIYKNAFYNRINGTQLGFEKITTIDYLANEKVIQTFNILPNINKSNLITTEEFNSTNNFNTSFTTFDNSVEFIGNQYFVKNNKVTTVNYLTQIAKEVINEYDNGGLINNGLITKITANTISGNLSSDVTENNYGIINSIPNYAADPNGSIFFKNKLSSVTTTVTRAGQAAYSNTNTLDYSALGILYSTKKDYGTTAEQTTNYLYDNFGNIKQTDLLHVGITTITSKATYDANGAHKIQSTNPLGQYQTIINNLQAGAPSEVTDIDGQIVQFIYNSFGQLIKKKFITKGYDVDYTSTWVLANGLIYKNKILHPGAPDITNYYDILGRITKTETDGFIGLITEQKIYNSNGTLAESYAPKLTSEQPEITAYTYDVDLRLKSLTNVIGTTTYDYIAITGGINTNIITPPSGYVTESVTDADGLLLSTKDNGGTTFYDYNSLKQITKVKLGLSTNNTIVENIYDPIFGRKIQIIDKASGTTNFTYDNANGILTETDARGITTTINYDATGRVFGKSIVDASNSNNNVTTAYTFYIGGNGLNKLHLVIENGNIIENNDYDNQGRLASTTKFINASNYTHTYTYNLFDQVINHVYPSGFGTSTYYNSNGFFSKICKLGSTDPLYTLNNKNGKDQPINYTMANGKTSEIIYSHGFAEKYQTLGLQDYLLDFNYATGNIQVRTENINGNLTEEFSYDTKDRLKETLLFIQGVEQSPNIFEYDNNAINTSPGNLTLKSDVGKYNYGTLPRAAVTTIQDPAANFLMPGSSPLLISHGTQDIAYNAYDLVQNISEYDYNNTSIQNIQTFKYNQGSRVMSTLTTAGINPRTRIYNGDYETQLEAGVLQQLHYISTPTGLSIIVLIENGVETNNYIYKDHLGSIVTVTDEAANIIAEQSFDAWGMPRDPYTWDASVSITNTNPTWLYRGFTGHEMMPEFALINMNARLYDYQNGRMLQPDAFTSAGSQGLNKYSYARNNPMVYVDPDGNNPLLVVAAIGAISSVVLNKGILNSSMTVGQAIAIGAVSGLVTAGLGSIITQGLSNHLYSGMHAATSFFRGALSAGAVSFSTSLVNNTLTQVILGGDFTSAFLFSLEGALYRGLASAVVGGVSGGLVAVSEDRKFWNGETKPFVESTIDLDFYRVCQTSGHCVPASLEQATYGKISMHAGGRILETNNLYTKFDYDRNADLNLYWQELNPNSETARIISQTSTVDHILNNNDLGDMMFNYEYRLRGAVYIDDSHAASLLAVERYGRISMNGSVKFAGYKYYLNDPNNYFPGETHHNYGLLKAYHLILR